MAQKFLLIATSPVILYKIAITVTSGSQHKLAFQLVAVYLSLSVMWIVLSDWFLTHLPIEDELKSRIEVWKGLLFVLLSTILLYYLVRSSARTQKKILDELLEKEERYRTTLDSMIEGCQIIGFD